MSETPSKPQRASAISETSPDAIAPLQVCALGRLRVRRGQDPLEFPTRKAQELFCFLLLHRGKALSREMISEYLWPMHEPAKAHHCLATTLWRLRQVLNDGIGKGQPYLLVERDTLAFNTSCAYWFDVQAFEEKARDGLADSTPGAESRMGAMEEAVSLYDGDLLEDCYDDWCSADRERLRLLLLSLLKQLQHIYRLGGRSAKAIACGQRLLSLDALQEDVHQELMRCYVDCGQRAQAMEQFRRCRETMQNELRSDPLPETWALYRQIRSDPEGKLSANDSKSTVTDLQIALSQFRHVLDMLEVAWETLQRASMDQIGAKTTEPTAKASSPTQGLVV